MERIPKLIKFPAELVKEIKKNIKKRIIFLILRAQYMNESVKD